MKKVFCIIMLIFIVSIFPASARAGGGGGGSSGGSGGGGSHTHSSHRDRGYIYPGVSAIPLAGMVGMIYYFKNRNIISLKKQAKPLLKEAAEKDDFWNENILKEKVKKAYFEIQDAWSLQDLERLKEFLTESLYEQWAIKIEWQRYKNQRNELSHIHLISKRIISVYDDEDDSQDYFWVAIEGRMEDTMYEDEKIISYHMDPFLEYWKFVRSGDSILLDQILQEDEWNDTFLS